MTKRINIIGRGRGANLGLNADGEKWAVCIPRPGADLMFSMHPKTDSKAAARRTQAKDDGIAVVTPENYPLKTVIETLQSKYFLESISYMIAMAILQSATEITLWGCNADPKKDDTIIPKRPGVDYWIGRAQGMGIDIKINGESCLFEPAGGLYGY